MAEAILALNAGSSSIKFALYELGHTAQHLMTHGVIDGIGEAPRFTIQALDGSTIEQHDWAVSTAVSHEDLLKPLLAWITSHLSDGGLVAVGHRIVHGGHAFRSPVRIDASVMTELERLVPWAPLHQPHHLAAVRAISCLVPDVVQIACFDTAFHADMPSIATDLALPRAYAAAGIRRYGFHGLSYEYLADRLHAFAPTLAEGRVIMAHLGNGASLCAMRHGRSIDTTMGFSTLDGLMMGTRCGSLDPGVVLHLLQTSGLSAHQIEHLLYQECGLLGVSGISGDMRTLQASDSPCAKEAIELFIYRIVKGIGALALALGGLDALVFSAGIGEHAASIRSHVCEGLAWLGVECDELANDLHETLISSAHSAVRVFVIHTDEEAMIARHAAELIQALRPQGMTV